MQEHARSQRAKVFDVRKPHVFSFLLIASTPSDTLHLSSSPTLFLISPAITHVPMRGHIDNLRAETLTSLSLTHVRFVGDDIYSKLFAFITLSPFGITCGYIAVILATRDLSIILMLAGQFLNECVNYVLKRVIKQERPTTGRLDLGLGEGYGMPSSHSQFMAYFATYMILLMHGSSGSVSPHLISLGVALWSILVIYSRVHLYYHTWQQVVAGSICGCAIAAAYYFFVQKFLRLKGMQDWMLDNAVARWFYLVEREQMDNVYQWEWDQFQQWRKFQQNKTD
ncbi:MAG: PAP2 superfamily-domain-containing protein [Benniella sp.]|nr:MAG: PAP2 superfamily-domain-containing protein [Benniella sp.]